MDVERHQAGARGTRSLEPERRGGANRRHSGWRGLTPGPLGLRPPRPQHQVPCPGDEGRHGTPRGMRSSAENEDLGMVLSERVLEKPTG